MATAARSAAERVFAIAELLEDIVLRVIRDELQDPFLRKKNLATSFKLQRISRDAYRNITGSTKIRELALIRTGTENLNTCDRISWLSYESSTWLFKPCECEHRDCQDVESVHLIQLPLQPYPPLLDVNSDASWRALQCLPVGTQPVKLEIWQYIPSRFWYLGMNPYPQANELKHTTGEYWGKRLTTWELDDEYKLGQLYDDLVRVEYDQGVAFATGRAEYEQRVAVAEKQTGGKPGNRNTR